VNLCPELRRLQAEHARWLARLAELQREDEGLRAGQLVALWAEEILPHCRREEEVLLPELARRIPETDAVIVFTLGDHLALRGLVRALRAATGAERRELAATLGERFADHVGFEERTLFPALQEQLGCGRLAALGSELTMGDGNRPLAGPPVTRRPR
jgi:hypothetical protein